MSRVKMGKEENATYFTDCTVRDEQAGAPFFEVRTDIFQGEISRGS
jgi:hypothetical protein